jgi:predicted transcriptional regulator
MLAKAEILSKMRDEGLTYTQIADLVGVSKQYVCDMVHKFRSTSKYAKSKEKSNDRVGKLVQEFNEKND